jgi:hypothetical protein
MIELSDEIRALFDGPNYAHIATLMPDGRKHTKGHWTAALHRISL